MCDQEKCVKTEWKLSFSVWFYTRVGETVCSALTEVFLHASDFTYAMILKVWVMLT